MSQERHYDPHGFGGCFHFGPKDVEKMKRMAKHFIGGFMRSHIPYNVEDLGDSYLITVPLAGRTKEDVKVSLINKHINVNADKPKVPERESLKDKPKDQEKNNSKDWCMPFFWKGFTFIDVNMDIPLPANVNTDTLTSKMANGLLKITMKKKPAKNIDISVD